MIKKEQTKKLIVIKERSSYKSDSLIADHTDSIKLVLWENIVDRTHAGKSYHFRNLKVRIFGDEKKKFKM